MKINAGEIRVGMLLEYKNDLWQVLKTQHVKPGKGGAFAQVEMKSLNKNTKLNERFRSSETCLLYTSPSPRDQRGSRMPSSA